MSEAEGRANTPVLVVTCFSNFMDRERRIGLFWSREGAEKAIVEDAGVSAFHELAEESTDRYRYARTGTGGDVLTYTIEEDEVQP